MEASRFWWILGFGVLMSVIALVGSISVLIRKETLEKILTPMVAFAAGTLLGTAFFHLLPTASLRMESDIYMYVWLIAGFLAFFMLEQFLHWHHSHRSDQQQSSPGGERPLVYMILLADGVHNFIGGLAVAAVFMEDVRLGVVAWSAAAAHEIPQELGDFSILVHQGMNRSRALWYNFLSAITFPLAGVLVYFFSGFFDVSVLLPFTAGNFLYIAAADLIPEIKHPDGKMKAVIHFVTFVLGILLLFGLQSFHERHQALGGRPVCDVMSLPQGLMSNPSLAWAERHCRRESP